MSSYSPDFLYQQFSPLFNGDLKNIINQIEYYIKSSDNPYSIPFSDLALDRNSKGRSKSGARNKHGFRESKILSSDNENSMNEVFPQ